MIWSKYLYEDTKLHKCCVGFLLFYAWLIRHESYPKLAVEYHLISEELS
jgi:hypothetical protein